MRPSGLQGPEFPVLLSYIWSAFIDLNNSRGAGLSGPMPITYEQIKAWKELTGSPLSPRDVETIKKLDTVYLRIANV